MAAVLIPERWTPLAWRDADWALQILFEGATWSEGDQVTAAFAHQVTGAGVQIAAEVVEADDGMTVVLRLPRAVLAPLSAGLFTAVVHRVSDDLDDDVVRHEAEAVLAVRLLPGLAEGLPVPATASSLATGAVIVREDGRVELGERPTGVDGLDFSNPANSFWIGVL